MQLDLAKLRDFAIRYTAAWCSQNPANVAAFYAPRGSLRINKGPASVGREAITQAVQGFMLAFPDLQVLMNNLVIQEIYIKYHWTLFGTNTGPGGTGKKVRISGFESWRINSDGLISESQGTFDEQEYQRQLKQGAESIPPSLKKTF